MLNHQTQGNNMRKTWTELNRSPRGSYMQTSPSWTVHFALYVCLNIGYMIWWWDAKELWNYGLVVIKSFVGLDVNHYQISIIMLLCYITVSYEAISTIIDLMFSIQQLYHSTSSTQYSKCAFVRCAGRVCYSSILPHTHIEAKQN